MSDIDVSGIVGLPFTTFPTGWFQVAWTQELAAGESRVVRYWNQDWVVFRGESGTPGVVSANCARRGEPLSYASVVNDYLVCGICHWQHAADGSIRSAAGVRLSTSVRALPAKDVNGGIFAWYDAKDEKPSFELPTFEEIGDRRFYPMYPHGALTDTMRVHPQMVSENVADVVHIHYIHKWIGIPSVERWEEDGAHMLNVFRGQIPTARGPVDTTIENQAAGIGFMATRFWGLRDILHFGAVTPIDPSHVQFRLSVWVAGEGDEDYSTQEPDRVAHAIYKAQHREVLGNNNDRPIWENQRYMEKAAFRREERDYVSYRRWVAQFYPHEGDVGAELMSSVA